MPETGRSIPNESGRVRFVLKPSLVDLVCSEIEVMRREEISEIYSIVVPIVVGTTKTVRKSVSNRLQ